MATMKFDIRRTLIQDRPLSSQPNNIFNILWMKNKEGSSSGYNNQTEDNHQFSSVLIPDTITFANNQPKFWYFMSKDGQILRKHAKNTTIAKIMKEFTEPFAAVSDSMKSDIVACFFYAEYCKGGEYRIILEHLNVADLCNLLKNRDLPKYCVLQKFVNPKSSCNQMFQSSYSSLGCSIERCVNVNRLKDVNILLHDRAMTYEGVPQLNNTYPVVNMDTHKAIQDMNNEIIHHVQRVSYQAITHSIMYFKQGANNRHYFLFARYICLKHYSKLLNDIPELTAPESHCFDNAARIKNTLYSNPVVNGQQPHSRFFVCPNCSNSILNLWGEFLVTFKAIIMAHNSQTKQPDEYFALVPIHRSFIRILFRNTFLPYLLKENYSYLSQQRFMDLQKSVHFMYKTIRVCESCSVEINKHTLSSVNYSTTGKQKCSDKTNDIRIPIVNVTQKESFARVPSAPVRARKNEVIPQRPSSATKKPNSVNVASRKNFSRKLNFAPKGNNFLNTKSKLQLILEKMKIQLNEFFINGNFSKAAKDLHVSSEIASANQLHTSFQTIGFDIGIDEWNILGQNCEPFDKVGMINVNFVDHLLAELSGGQIMKEESLSDPLRIHTKSPNVKPKKTIELKDRRKSVSGDPHTTAIIPEFSVVTKESNVPNQPHSPNCEKLTHKKLLKKKIHSIRQKCSKFRCQKQGKKPVVENAVQISDGSKVSFPYGYNSTEHTSFIRQITKSKTQENTNEVDDDNQMHQYSESFTLVRKFMKDEEYSLDFRVVSDSSNQIVNVIIKAVKLSDYSKQLELSLSLYQIKSALEFPGNKLPAEEQPIVEAIASQLEIRDEKLRLTSNAHQFEGINLSAEEEKVLLAAIS